MSRFVRASKVRHVYANAPKPDQVYSGIRLSTATGDHQYIKANTKYMAIPVGQGGGLAVFEMDRDEMRLGPGVVPVLDGHRGPVLDFDFNPHHTNLIATGGDDCTAKVWGIPPGGLKESQSDALCDLVGHQKKVSVVLHHPTVQHVLATGSSDRTVKIWDVENQKMVVNIEHGEMIHGLAWSSQGSILGSTCRDKNFRLMDARNGTVIHEHMKVFEGGKCSKVEFLPGAQSDSGEAICTVGFTRQSKRQFKLWDTRKLGADAYATANIDQGAGVILPFYDEGTKMLYMCGKGDANIRYYEIVPADPYQFSINEFRTTSPCRGMCMVPKRAVDTTKCEVARFLKLCSNTIEPISFICPRKSSLFQEDLYPDAYAGKSTLMPDDYFGSDHSAPFKAKIHRITMDPSKRPAPAGNESGGIKVKKKATYEELEERVAHLEGLLRKNNIKF